jgi:predicted nucleotidyltransferase component of viral defense system
MSRDLLPISRAQFLAPIPADQRLTLIDRYEADYALTRLVHLNCGAVDEFEEEPTTFVLKGGFAIRHLYAGPRFSRDADVLPADPDLDLIGPDDLLIPGGMERGQTTVGDAIESWKVRIQFRTISRNRRSFISCDVNDLERLLRKRPPQRATFESRFTAPFPVWAATVEEILAEKLVALMRRRADRIRDAFDVHHVLAQPTVEVDASAARGLYADAASRQGVGITLERVPAEIRAMATDSSCANAWTAQLDGALASGVPPFPPLAEALAVLVEERLASVRA